MYEKLDGKVCQICKYNIIAESYQSGIDEKIKFHYCHAQKKTLDDDKLKIMGCEYFKEKGSWLV